MTFSKKFIIIFVSLSILTSLIVSLIMTHYFQTDSSKDRFELTQKYKELKDVDYKYDGERGRALYQDLCLKCHGKQGRGSLAYPPLYAAQVVLAPEPKKLVKIVLKGLRGEIVRNEKTYNSLMPAFGKIPATDLTHLINFVRKTFGNPNHDIVDHVDVIKLKIDTVEQTKPWEESQL